MNIKDFTLLSEKISTTTLRKEVLVYITLKTKIEPSLQNKFGVSIVKKIAL